MNIGIITYEKPHKKTQEIVNGLVKLGHKDLTLIIDKFKRLKNNKNDVLFHHRPFQFEGRDSIEISKFCLSSALTASVVLHFGQKVLASLCASTVSKLGAIK